MERGLSAGTYVIDHACRKREKIVLLGDFTSKFLVFGGINFLKGDTT